MVKNMFFKNKFNNSTFDYLVVGLGNPGREYENTRHNAGFMVVDRLCEKLSAGSAKSKHKADIREAKIGEKRLLIIKPQTYMNLSGQAVVEVSSFYKISKDKIIVIFDDTSLPIGKIRIRKNGTHGGHNGMKNISELLSTNDILRIKVGIGEKPHHDFDMKDWVLGHFTQDERKTLDEAIDRSISAVTDIVKFNVDTAMNRYN